MGQVDYKLCSNGTFVAEEDRPAINAVSCRACPYGREWVSGSAVYSTTVILICQGVSNVIRIFSGFAWVPAMWLATVYYSLAVWRLKPILSACLRFHSHLSGGLRLRNYRAVAGNHKVTSRLSVFACFCGGYSNRVKRLGRLSGNFILRRASLFNKGLKTCTFIIRYKHLEQSVCLSTAH